MDAGEYNGVAFELGIRDTRALVANFHAADRGVTAAIERLADKYVALFDSVWESLTPVDTAFMVEHRRIVRTRAGLGFEAGWSATDFIDAGLAFYPFFQEFGTYKMRAQPSLGPAFRYVSPQYAADLRVALQGAIARLDRRGA